MMDAPEGQLMGPQFEIMQMIGIIFTLSQKLRGLHKVRHLRNSSNTKISLASLRKFLCDKQNVPLRQVLEDNHVLTVWNDINDKGISVNLLHRNVSDLDMHSLSSLADLYCLKVAGTSLLLREYSSCPAILH